MQSFIWTLCGRVDSRQRGLTGHRHSTDPCLNPNSSNLSASDGLNYELADDILQFDNDRLSQPPETEIFPNAEAPIDDTVQVHSFQHDDWHPLAPFVTPQQWQLWCSIVDTNLGKTKLNNILKRRLIVPNANAKNPDQVNLLIADMEEIDGLVCRWEETSVNIEGKATPFWYRNPIAVVRYILRHPPFKDDLSYVPVKQMDYSGERICAEMWTADWWWKTQASFLVLSERLFLVRFSLCLGELECQREHVREIMSERSCQRDHVREIMSERACQRDRVSENVAERTCQRVFQRACQRASESYCQRERNRDSVSVSSRESG